MKPVAYIDHSGHPRHLSYLQGAKERELYGPLRPLYEQPDAAAWWALVMGAAASIEDAANCLRDPAAKKQAEGAAKHYREAAQKLWDTPGVPTPGLTQQLTIPVDWMCASQAEHQGDCTKWCGQARCLRAPAGVPVAGKVVTVRQRGASTTEDIIDADGVKTGEGSKP